MSNNLNNSKVKEAERNIDHLFDLFKRRPFIGILVLLVFMAPAGYSVYLNNKLSDTVRERDSIATQLAPFLAIANQRFENSPPDKRLDLLVQKVDEVLLKLDSAMSPRSLSQTTIDRLLKRISTVQPASVEVSSVVGDNDSLRLATQIRDTLRKGDGWQVDGVTQFISSKPIEHISFQIRENPNDSNSAIASQMDALIPIFEEFGYKPVANINGEVPLGTIYIIVGSK